MADKTPDGQDGLKDIDAEDPPKVRADLPPPPLPRKQEDMGLQEALIAEAPAPPGGAGPPSPTPTVAKAQKNPGDGAGGVRTKDEQQECQEHTKAGAPQPLNGSFTNDIDPEDPVNIPNFTVNEVPSKEDFVAPGKDDEPAPRSRS